MKSFLTKLGVVFGYLSFAALLGCAYHMHDQATKANENAPPTLATLQDSVVRVQSTTGICSGFVLAGTHKVVTAAHCFDFAAGQAIITFNDQHQELYHTETVSTDPSDPISDRAVLVPDQDAGVKFPVGLNICKAAPAYGDPIVMMGSPLGIDQVMSFGHIGKPMDGDLGIIIDIALMPGNSGGPVIERDTGCVVGTAEMIHLAVPGSDVPLGVNYAIPVTL